MSTYSINPAFQITSTNIRLKPHPINLETKTIKFKTITVTPKTIAKRYINSSKGVLLLYFIFDLFVSTKISQIIHSTKFIFKWEEGFPLFPFYFFYLTIFVTPL